jgi:hypothetical protein
MERKRFCAIRDKRKSSTGGYHTPQPDDDESFTRKNNTVEFPARTGSGSGALEGGFHTKFGEDSRALAP